MRRKKLEWPSEYVREYDLADRMRELGADDPDQWAHSELTEDIPQEATWLLARAVRAEVDSWDSQSIRKLPVAQALIADGADPASLAELARAVAFRTAFAVVHLIDEERDSDAPSDAPGWALVETRDLDGERWFSGRKIAGVHESLGVLHEGPSGPTWD
jgi:hypothetical protein